MRGNSFFSSRTEVLCRSAVLFLPLAALHMLPPPSSLCWVSTDTGLVLMWLFCFWRGRELGRCEHPIFVLDMHYLSALLTSLIPSSDILQYPIASPFLSDGGLLRNRENNHSQHNFWSFYKGFKMGLRTVAGMCLLLIIFWERGWIFIVWTKCQPGIFYWEFQSNRYDGL